MEAHSSSTMHYLRKTDEAKRLRVTARTINNWMAAGRIPFIKMGRIILFDPSKVDAALSRFEHQVK